MHARVNRGSHDVAVGDDVRTLSGQLMVGDCCMAAYV